MYIFWWVMPKLTGPLSLSLPLPRTSFNGHVYVKLPRKVVIALRIPRDKKAKRSQIIRRSVTPFVLSEGKRYSSWCDFVYGNVRLAERRYITSSRRWLTYEYMRSRILLHGCAPHELLCWTRHLHFYSFMFYPAHCLNINWAITKTNGQRVSF